MQPTDMIDRRVVRLLVRQELGRQRHAVQRVEIHQPLRHDERRMRRRSRIRFRMLRR